MAARLKGLPAVLATAVLAAAARQAMADTANWSNAGGGDFNSATNWSTGVVPDGVTVADFGLVGGYTVTIGQALTSVGGVAVEAGVVTVAPGSSSDVLAILNNLSVAGAAGDSACLTLQAGLYEVPTHGDPGTVTVGAGGSGSLVLSAARVITDELLVPGSETASGVVTVSGTFSRLTATNAVIGQEGAGTLQVAAKGVVVLNGSAMAGVGTGSVGVISVAGTQSSMTVGTLGIGVAGTGTLTLGTQGTVTAQSVDVGDGLGSTGVVMVDSSGSTLTAGSLVIGDVGAGRIQVTGSGMIVVSGLMALGAQSGSTGELDVTGPSTGFFSRVQTGTLTLGVQAGKPTLAGGSGSVTVGTHSSVTVSGATILGSNAGGTGSITMSGGTLTTGWLDMHGSSTVTFSSGEVWIKQTALTTPGDLSVGASGVGTTSELLLSNSSGTTTLSVGGNLYVGGTAAGAANSGIVSLNSTVATVGGVTELYGPGTLVLSGGSLQTGQLVSGGGLMTWNSGTVQITNGDVAIGAGTALGSSVSLGSGKKLLVSGTVTLQAGSNVTLTGGTLTAGALASTGGAVAFTYGVMQVTNGDVTIGDGQALGSTLTLGTGASLSVSGKLINEGQLVLSGGKLTVDTIEEPSARFVYTSGSLVVKQDLVFDTGTGWNGLTLSGGSTLSTTGNITIGQTGAGALTAEEGGVVCANLVLAAEAGSTATLNGGAYASVAVYIGGTAAGEGGAATVTLTQEAISAPLVAVYDNSVVHLRHGSIANTSPAMTFSNHGLILVDGTGDAEIAGGVNYGTVHQTAAANLLFNRMDNQGLMQIDAGTLTLFSGSNHGTIQMGEDTTLEFDTNWSINSGTVTMPASATVRVATPEVSVDVPTSWLGTWQLYGSLDVNASLQTGAMVLADNGTSFGLTGVTVAKGQVLNVGGVLTWAGQWIAAPGEVVAAGGVVILNGSTPKSLTGTLTNGGAGSWNGGTLTFGNAVFNNAAGATFNIGAVTASGSSMATFNNSGTLTYDGNLNTFEVGQLNNSGLLHLQFGTVKVDSGTLGGSVVVDTSAFLFAKGLTISGNVSGTGTVDIIAAPAATTVTGAYAPRATLVGNGATLVLGSGAILAGMGTLTSNAGSQVEIETGSAATMAGLSVWGMVEVTDALSITGTLTLGAGGELVSERDLTVGQLNWMGGILDISQASLLGVSSVTIPASGMLIADVDRLPDTVTIYGTLVLMDDGQVVATSQGPLAQPIPEVGTVGMLGVGAAGLVRRRRKGVRARRGRMAAASRIDE
ncbi:MAG TPA: hypothetical protein VHQ47_04730 [Phycisphaerae bacterium]|nr:hypothetical protein [Phycisphaerae bacterium]